ncbi:hypothetical protein LCGC14_2896680, partial [marine sediment metagenome]
MQREETRVKNYLGNLERQVRPHNYKLIKEFIEKLKATPNEPGAKRQYTVLSRLKTIENILDKPLDQLKEEDLIKLNNAMREKGIESAKYYRRVLK